MAIRLGLVGLGKITVDQHFPSLQADPAYELIGGVSPGGLIAGLDTFESVDALFEAREVDAIAVNTPPQVRADIARRALAAGKHVLLEKPPTTTTAELAELARIANLRRVTLYTSWHSQHAPAVPLAKRWLDGRDIRSVQVRWCEDVRQWHPRQTWIWQSGGLGVFDPGINALSILTKILPARLVLHSATFEVPGNCDTPIAADLCGRIGEVGRFEARFNFLQVGTPTWSIVVHTDAGQLELNMGGAELKIDGITQHVGPSREYSSIYRRFADLIASGLSEIDMLPLALTADAFLIARCERVADFAE